MSTNWTAGAIEPGWRPEGSRYLVHVPDPFRPGHGRDARPVALVDLLTDATIEHVRQATYQLQNQWYCHGGRDFTQWNGFSLGRMVTGPALRTALHGVLSNYLAFCELLARHPNTTGIDVRHDPGIVPDIWQYASDRLGISYRLVVDQPNEPAPKTFRRRTLRQRLTRKLTRLQSLLRGRHPLQAGSRPLVMLVASGSLTLRHADFCARLDSSPNVDVIRTSDVLSRSQRRTISRRITTEAEEHFVESWDGLQQELQRCDWLREATRGGHDYVMPILRETFIQRLPEIAAMVELARTTLLSTRPTLLIAEAQSGNDDYVWSSVAKSLEIPVVSMTNEQPTLPIGAYSFPPVSDYVLSMSPLSRSWWLAKGYREDAILPIRSRYLEAPERKRRATRKKVPHRLVALCTVTRLSPEQLDVPVTHARKFVKTILAAAQTQRDIQFIIKFHPGTPRLEGQASFASQVSLVKQHAPPNVQIAPLHSDMSSYLQRADCLVCSSSSFTIFEALAHGIPCILAPPRSKILDQAPLFHAMKTHSRVTDLENIAREIDAVRSNVREIPASWSEGVFYSDPEPSDVVEQLAQKLYSEPTRRRAAA
jgi:glycosyltransferase involved in cell wall biosynthesis